MLSTKRIDFLRFSGGTLIAQYAIVDFWGFFSWQFNILGSLSRTFSRAAAHSGYSPT
jgi:hypothetical protein